MTCTTSMCLSKLETSSRPSISVFSPSLFLPSSPLFILSLSHFWFFFVSLFHFQACVISTWVYTCVCVCVCSVSICVQLLPHVFKKGNVLGFMSTYIKTHNTIQYWISSSSSFSFPSQKFHVPFFVSARHPIDTFAIQQKKYFYYSHILHLGS